MNELNEITTRIGLILYHAQELQALLPQHEKADDSDLSIIHRRAMSLLERYGYVDEREQRQPSEDTP